MLSLRFPKNLNKIYDAILDCFTHLYSDVRNMFYTKVSRIQSILVKIHQILKNWQEFL